MAKRRAKLGFNDKGAEEVDDATLDTLEFQKERYEEKVFKKNEIREVKLATDIEYTTAHEALNSMPPES